MNLLIAIYNFPLHTHDYNYKHQTLLSQYIYTLRVHMCQRSLHILSLFPRFLPGFDVTLFAIHVPSGCNKTPSRRVA